MKINEDEASKRADYGEEVYERKEFQEKVRDQYDLLQEDDWKVVDANDSIENVHKKILEIVKG